MSDIVLRCSVCGRKMRPARTPVAEAPGTVPMASSGLCRTHWRHKTGETKPPRVHTVHLQVARDVPDDAVAAVRALVARRGCPEVLDILGLGQAS